MNQARHLSPEAEQFEMMRALPDAIAESASDAIISMPPDGVITGGQ